jgi:porin
MFVKSSSYRSLARRVRGAQACLVQKDPAKTGRWMSGGPLGLTFLLSFGVAPSVLAQTPAAGQALATEQTPAAVQAPAAGQTPATEQTPATPTGLWDRSNLLGEMGGLRP